MGCATSISACAQAWILETVVDGEGEGQAGSCRWNRSGVGRMPRFGPMNRINREANT